MWVSAVISTSLATSGVCCAVSPFMVIMRVVGGMADMELILGTTEPTEGIGEAMRGDIVGMLESCDRRVTPAAVAFCMAMSESMSPSPVWRIASCNYGSDVPET